MPKSYTVGDTAYNFPDNFSDDQVETILRQQGIIPEKSFGEQAGDFLRELGSNVAGLGQLPSQVGYSLRHPIQAFQAHNASTGQILQRAEDAWNRGDYVSAIGHGLMVPTNVVAPGMGRIGSDVGQKIERGEGGSALADALTLDLMKRVPAVAGKAAYMAAPMLPTAAQDALTSMGGRFTKLAPSLLAHQENLAIGDSANRAIRAMGATGSRDPGLVADVQRAMPIAKDWANKNLPNEVGDLTDVKQAGPIKLAIGRPEDIHKLDQAIYVMDGSQEATWQKYKAYLDAAQNSGMQIPTRSISTAAKLALNQDMYNDPKLGGAIANEQARLDNTYGQSPTMTPNQLQARKEFLNKELDNEFKQSNLTTLKDATLIPSIGVKMAELAQLKDLLYTWIGGGDPHVPQELMKDYGSQRTVAEALRAQRNYSTGGDWDTISSALPQAMRGGAQISLQEARGAISNLSNALGKVILPAKSPGNLMQSAFKRVGQEPVEYPPPPQHPPQSPLRPSWPMPPPGGPPPPMAPYAPPPGPNGPALPGNGGPPRLSPPPHVDVQMGPQALPPASQGQLSQPLIPKSRQLAAPPEAPGATQPMPGGFQPPPALGPAPKPPIITEPPPQLKEQQPLQFNPKASNWVDPETGEVFDSALGPPSQPFAFGGSAGMPMLHHGNPGFSMGARLNRRVTGSLPHMPSLPKPKPMGGAKMAPATPKVPAAPAAPAIPGFPQSPVPVIPAAKGVQTSAPTKAVVGELGPERIDHSDGRPSEIVSGAQSRVLGANGQDKVTPLAGKKPPMGIVRGSSNIPMNDRGRQEASALGQHLAKAGGLDELHMSDLDRTVETAKLIAAAGGAKQMVKPDAGLRSWGLGGAEGTPVTPELDNAIHRMAQEAPDTPLPGKGPASTQPGESYNQFKDRHLKAMAQLLARLKANPKAKIGVVTHNKDMRLDHAWITAGAPGPAESANILPTRDGFHNAGAQHISLGANGKPQVKPWKPGDKLKPGILQIRHGETDWSPASDENAS